MAEHALDFYTLLVGRFEESMRQAAATAFLEVIIRAQKPAPQASRVRSCAVLDNRVV